jgi:hypothetical protein
MTFILLLPIALLAQFGLAPMLGWLLMRPGIAIWRGALTEPRWRWVAVVVGLAPAWALPLGMVLLRSQWPGASANGLPAAMIALGGAACFFALPVVGGCWLLLPREDGQQFRWLRAWFTAFLFTIANFALLVALPRYAFR